MDETAKILIGTISGFLIAFLAEPVKIYFQNLSKRNNLKTTLYKELFNDVALFAEVTLDNWAEIKKSLKPFIHFEAYNYAINNEISVLFQLQESIDVRTIYKILYELFYNEELTEEEAKDLIKTFHKGFLDDIKQNRLDKNLLIRCGKDTDIDFNGIIEQYKQLIA